MEAQSEQGRAGALSPDDPRTLLPFLAFLEQKIGHLRGVICSAPRQIVAAELSCIAVQLVSVSKSLAGVPAEEDARSPPTLSSEAAHEGGSGDSSDHHAEDGGSSSPSAYEVIELDKEEILAPHVHSCQVCGKGFKRDANLRMHMRGHGDEYKTAAALAKPGGGRDAPPSPAPEARTPRRRLFYSCPYAGCKRNREHKSFQPLKTAVCVKNHYRRSHCDKSFTCRRCNVKRFSVLADLRTHEKHCGRDRWVCSCGTSFSRKDKLFAHVAAFDGHAPALPPDDEEEDAAAGRRDAANATGSSAGSDQMAMNGEAVGRMASMECFPDNMFDGFSCSGIGEASHFAGGHGQCLDDGQGFLSPMAMGPDSCGFDGFDFDLF